MVTDELLLKQNHLESEVNSLKNTIQKLGHRVAVLENFIKTKHGQLALEELLEYSASSEQCYNEGNPLANGIITSDNSNSFRPPKDDSLEASVPKEQASRYVIVSRNTKCSEGAQIAAAQNGGQNSLDVVPDSTCEETLDRFERKDNVVQQEMEGLITKCSTAQIHEHKTQDINFSSSTNANVIPSSVLDETKEKSTKTGNISRKKDDTNEIINNNNPSSFCINNVNNINTVSTIICTAKNLNESLQQELNSIDNINNSENKENVDNSIFLVPSSTPATITSSNNFSPSITSNTINTSSNPTARSKTKSEGHDNETSDSNNENNAVTKSKSIAEISSMLSNCSENNNNIASPGVLLVDFCCQTDLEEDPEVYYFAGGRHVSSQTCDDGEYEPLIPFVVSPNTKLEIIVLSNSSSSPANNTTGLQSFSSSVSSFSNIEFECSGEINAACTSSSLVSDSLLINNNQPFVEVPVKVVKSGRSTSTSVGVEIEPEVYEEKDNIIHNSTASSSSSTNNNSNKEKGDGWKTVTTRSNRTKWSQSSSSLGSSAANSSRGSLDRGSIGDYRDRNSVGSGSHSGSVIGRGRLNSGSGRRGSPSHSNNNNNSNSNTIKINNTNSSSNNNNNRNYGPKNRENNWNSSSSSSYGRSSASYLKSRFYQPSSTISLPVLNHPVDESNNNSSNGTGKTTGGRKNVNHESESGYGSREKLIRKKTTLTSSLEVKSRNPRPSSQQRSTQTTKPKSGLLAGTTTTTTSSSSSVAINLKKAKNDILTSTTSLASFTSSTSVHPKYRTTIGFGKVASSFPSVNNSTSSVSKSSISSKSSSSDNKSLLNDAKAIPARKKVDQTSTASNGLLTNSSAANRTSVKSHISGKIVISQSATNSKRPTQPKVGVKSNLNNTNNSNNTFGNRKDKERGTANPNPITTKTVAIVKPLELDKIKLDREDPMQDSINSDVEMQNDNDKWKEQDTESSNDDEEIQRKDAALESIQGTLELLQLELLQVEKDFEEIENRAADNVSVDEGSNISESELTTSSPSTFLESEAGDTMSDFGDLDQFFFIAIDENSSLNSDEVMEERIVAKKEKLRLSPAKKCDSAETLKRHRAKLANAERNREKLLQAKYNRYVELSERFASLNETTKRLVEERSELMMKANERRNRAAEKRKLYLKSIVKKAHDEDSKAKEIAFINLLEAQNKRHDYLANVQEVEDRLNSIQEERKLKFEDRAIKVQAVIERQGHIRHDWETKLAAMQEKRRKVDERIMRTKEEKAKERSELAQEKARDREERLSALNAAKQAEKEELQKKIQQKQEETARRHEENIEHIRQKAIELTLPRTPDDQAQTVTVRICSLCKVTMQSEVQELAHLRGRTHLDAVRKMEQESGGSKIENFGLKFITDVQADKVEPGIRHDKNRSKKHCKKLMLKLVSNGEDFEKIEKDRRVDKPWGDPTLKAKVVKNLKELERSINLFSSGKGSLSIANSMDKLLADVRRTVNKNKSVQDAMVSLRAFSVTSKILQCTATDLPPKILIGACNLIVGATYQHLNNGIYVIRSTVVCSLINLVVSRLNNLIPDGNRWLTSSPLGTNECKLQADSVADFAIETLFTLLSIVPDPFDGITKKDISLKDSDVLDIIYRTQDIIGYLVAANVIDRLSVYCSGVQGPVDNQPGVANLLKISIDFLTALVWCLTFCLEKRSSLNGGKREADPTQLLATLESSELAGSVSMSYALLLYQGAPTRPRLSTTIATTTSTTANPIAAILVNDNSSKDSDKSRSSASSVSSMSSASSSCGTSSTASASSSSSTPPPHPPGVRTASVVKSTLCLVNAVARLDIQALQNVLGSEAMSLQFRHIASQLLWQVVPHREDRTMWGLLQELFIAIGNFTVKNNHNQVTIQSGQTPTVLQQLCGVAKEFLSEIRLSRTILPTLIAATHGCPENRALLIQEDFPVDLLDGFLESKFSYANLILKRLVTPPPSSTPTSNKSSSSPANKD